jgi:hypothetical protein
MISLKTTEPVFYKSASINKVRYHKPKNTNAALAKHAAKDVLVLNLILDSYSIYWFSILVLGII